MKIYFFLNLSPYFERSKHKINVAIDKSFRCFTSIEIWCIVSCFLRKNPLRCREKWSILMESELIWEYEDPESLSVVHILLLLRFYFSFESIRNKIWQKIDREISKYIILISIHPAPRKRWLRLKHSLRILQSFVFVFR